MIYTTLNAIRAHEPCVDGWAKLLKHLGKKKADDDLLPLVTVLDSNGIEDALWCMRCVPDAAPAWRMYAVWCAWQVRHLMRDERSLKALEVAKNYALGLATDDELVAAWDAARVAARVARGDARDAAEDAAEDAAYNAAWAAVWAAARDARAAAWVATRGVDREAAWAALDAEISKQTVMLRRVLTCPTMGEAVYMMLGELK
jgi:hypothetical protein